MEETTATVVIMGRNYSLRVAADDMEILQSAARRLDEMARNFSQQFPSKDHQDHIAMVALLQEIQLVRLQQQPQSSDISGIEQRLKKIDEMLEPQSGEMRQSSE